MSDEKKTIKFQMLMSPSEAEAIDDWGFAHRIRTRAEAIRRLTQIGILFDEKILDEMLSAFSDGMKEVDAAFSEIEKIEKEHNINANNLFDALASVLFVLGRSLRLSFEMITRADVITLSEDVEQALSQIAAWQRKIEEMRQEKSDFRTK